MQLYREHNRANRAVAACYRLAARRHHRAGRRMAGWLAEAHARAIWRPNAGHNATRLCRLLELLKDTEPAQADQPASEVVTIPWRYTPDVC